MSAAPWTDEALALSAELARDLGQPGIRREGPVFYVPSRTRAGHEHKVAWALDGSLICNCEAGTFGLECWAAKAVREEIRMTTTEQERYLPAVQVMPEQALLPTERTYALIDRAAQLALSGAVALPKELNSVPKVAAVMLYGWELGLKPMTALQHLYIVNGRVQPSAQVMAGLLRARTDAKISVVESTDKKCTLRLTWPSRGINETWTCDWAEIEKAKLQSQGTWATYPRDKLVWHTTKRLLRIYAPDVINGLVGPVIVSEGDEEPEEDDELYNEGDGPEAYIDGAVVDTETGEIHEEPLSPDPASFGPEVDAPPPDEEPTPSPEVTAEAIAIMWQVFLNAEPDIQRTVVNELTRNHRWAGLNQKADPVAAMAAGKGTPDERAALLAYLTEAPL